MARLWIVAMRNARRVPRPGAKRSGSCHSFRKTSCTSSSASARSRSTRTARPKAASPWRRYTSASAASRNRAMATTSAASLASRRSVSIILEGTELLGRLDGPWRSLRFVVGLRTISAGGTDRMSTHRPMEGIRILDLADHTFVPAASAILSDWGAEVINIEHIARGDAARGLASSGMAIFAGEVSPILEHANRGKLSLALDLNQDEGREILYQLAAISDVFLTNKMPSVREKLKTDID